MAIVDGQSVNAAASNPAWLGQEFFKQGFTQTAASGSLLSLTSSSTTFQEITGSTNQNIALPSATTLTVKRLFRISNQTTGKVYIYKNDGTTLVTLLMPGNDAWLSVTDVSTTNGTWYCDNKAVLTQTLTNNASATDITGLIFDRTATSSAIVFYEVTRSTSTQEAVGLGKLSLFWRPFSAAWDIVDSNDGDATGITWAVSAAGQVSYTSTNLTGTSYSGKGKFIIMPFYA